MGYEESLKRASLKGEIDSLPGLSPWARRIIAERILSEIKRYSDSTLPYTLGEIEQTCRLFLPEQLSEK